MSTEQQLFAKYCDTELTAIEKKIKELRDRIMALVMKADRSKEENDALDILKSRLEGLVKDKQHWSKRLDLAQQADIAAVKRQASDSTSASASSRQASDSTSASASSVTFPHSARKRRCKRLNEIILAKQKNNNVTDTTGYSLVTWDDVESIFPLVHYVQPMKPLPDDVFQVLEAYVKFNSKCLGFIATCSEGQRQCIAPILVSVCQLFKNDVILEIEEDLQGDSVKVHGHYEFILRRGNKRICVFVAKKDDLEQGLVQTLLGCEIASELEHSDCVYGIVANYIEWLFIRNLPDKIETNLCTLDIRDGIPTAESLAKLAGKIFSMLSSTKEDFNYASGPNCGNSMSGKRSRAC
ncbi:hypothetical protein MP638_003484 [Amoeboaphelidium occidentale]|nr:hypothetical protein MP638_003484 [Amoeboaphelidium occidentale]